MWTKYKRFVLQTYPKYAKWAGGGGGKWNGRYQEQPAQCGEYKKWNQKYCILVVFKLPDCTSNNTYGELRFNVFYLELCQFVGGGQLGKALAYCFFKSIGSIFYWNLQIPFIVIREWILWSNLWTNNSKVF